MSTQATPWHILGAGAIGSLFAAELIHLGLPVRLILRQRHAASTWQLKCGDETRTFQPRLETATDTVPIHQLLITTKAHQVLPALASIRHRIAPDATLVLLHNGLGPQQQLAKMDTKWALFAGTTTEGAYRTSSEVTVHAGSGESWFGPLNAAAIDAGERKLQSLLATRLRCGYDRAIMKRLWQKLAINSAINGLTALHDCQNGALADNPLWCDQMQQLSEETAALARALQQPLFDAPLFERARAVASATAANYSSTLQDVRAGRVTELQQINGFLLREAERINFPLPHHQQLLAALKQRGVQWATD